MLAYAKIFIAPQRSVIGSFGSIVPNMKAKLKISAFMCFLKVWRFALHSIYTN